MRPPASRIAEVLDDWAALVGVRTVLLDDRTVLMDTMAAVLTARPGSR